MNRADIVKTKWFLDLILEAFMAGVEDGYARGTGFGKYRTSEESAAVCLAEIIERESEYAEAEK